MYVFVFIVFCVCVQQQIQNANLCMCKWFSRLKWSQTRRGKWKKDATSIHEIVYICNETRRNSLRITTFSHNSKIVRMLNSLKHSHILCGGKQTMPCRYVSLYIHFFFRTILYGLRVENFLFVHWIDVQCNICSFSVFTACFFSLPFYDEIVMHMHTAVQHTPHVTSKLELNKVKTMNEETN